jgi:hypothetical protein
MTTSIVFTKRPKTGEFWVAKTPNGFTGEIEQVNAVTGPKWYWEVIDGDGEVVALSEDDSFFQAVENAEAAIREYGS